MASTINGTSTGNGGLITTGDDSGVLNIQTNETTAITVDASQNLTFTNGVNAPNTFGFKNRLINGSMAIDQRATTVTSATSGAYTVDRWNTYFDQSYSIAQIADAPSGYTYSLKVTKTNTSQSTYAFLVQYIEGLNAVDLAFGTSSASTVTLSFWVKSSITGSFAASLTNSAENRSYAALYTINSANTWEQKTITIAGDTSGTWLKTNGKGISVQFNFGAAAGATAPNAWVASNNLAPTGSVNLGTTNNSTFQITGVQLEKGTQATSFDFRSIGTELALCYRYYWRLTSVGSGYNYCKYANGFAQNGTSFNFQMPFPVPMRTTPSGIDYSLPLNIFDGAANYVISTVVIDQLNPQSAGLYGNTTGMTAYRPGAVQSTNSQASYIGFTAEL